MKSWSFTDGSQMPVGTLYCIGRNYAEHAREMGAEVPGIPLIFLKPPSAAVADGGSVVRPAFSADLHHEVEMVVVIGADADDISPEEALSVVAGYAVGLDMTLRDVQSEAKKKGSPWSLAKSFKTSAPVSAVVPASQVPNPDNLEISLDVNGQARQHGNTAQMERNVAWLVAWVSSVFGLRRGDCIFTGTPHGVGPVVPGDVMHARLGSLASLSATVSEA